MKSSSQWQNLKFPVVLSPESLTKSLNKVKHKVSKSLQLRFFGNIF